MVAAALEIEDLHAGPALSPIYHLSQWGYPSASRFAALIEQKYHPRRRR
jgi:hypothetical protein